MTMSDLATRPWTTGEFFAWQDLQRERYELVGGFPLKMMTGASNRHDDIVVNILAALRTKLRGTPCRPFTADGSVETFAGQIRRPDIGVDCGPRDPSDYKAGNPVVVVEVLSKSTQNFDRLRKIDEYKALSAIQHIVFVEQDRPRITAWNRDSGGSWAESRIAGLDGVLELSAVGISIACEEIYEDIEVMDLASIKDR